MTLSAPYGAGGGVIGPQLADRLGIPFHNRAIPATVSAELGVELESVLPHDGQAETGLRRLLSVAARLPSSPLGDAELAALILSQVDETVIAEHTASVVRHIADGDGGVILGRAGAAILAGHPRALHVRLQGPKEARIQHAMKLAGISEEVARDRQRRVDTARAAYVKRLYGQDSRDVKLYHVVLDSSAISWDACVDALYDVALDWASRLGPAAPPQ